jgi:hypothetical protein
LLLYYKNANGCLIINFTIIFPKIIMTTMEFLPHQINFIKECQKEIFPLKEKEEKGNSSMIVEIEYPRINKQNFGL